MSKENGDKGDEVTKWKTLICKLSEMGFKYKDKFEAIERAIIYDNAKTVEDCL
jgi:hypothetical protein